MAHDRGKKTSQGNLHVRCADITDSNCNWEARGHSDADIMQKAEQHGREAHGMQHMDNAARNRVRDMLHRRKAA